MAITKQRKVETLDALKGDLKGAESVVFINFHGLKVVDTVALRRALRAKAVGWGKDAHQTRFERRGHRRRPPELAGEIAIAYGKDAVLP